MPPVVRRNNKRQRLRQMRRNTHHCRALGQCLFDQAQVALRQIAAGNTDPFYKAKLQTARFYFAKLFPETGSLMRTVRAGAKPVMDTAEALA